MDRHEAPIRYDSNSSLSYASPTCLEGRSIEAPSSVARPIKAAYQSRIYRYEPDDVINNRDMYQQTGEPPYRYTQSDTLPQKASDIKLLRPMDWIHQDWIAEPNNRSLTAARATPRLSADYHYQDEKSRRYKNYGDYNCPDSVYFPDESRRPRPTYLHTHPSPSSRRCVHETPSPYYYSSPCEIPSLTESSEDITCSSCNSDNEGKRIEIAPGMVVRLHGAEETTLAIRNDFYMPFQCSCGRTIFCIQNASFIVCPCCKVISPIEGVSGGGVGLGFTMEHLAQYQEDIVGRS